MAWRSTPEPERPASTPAGRTSGAGGGEGDGFGVEGEAPADGVDGSSGSGQDGVELARIREGLRHPAGAELIEPFVLIGSTHLLFADRTGTRPTTEEVRRFVSSVVPG